MKILSMLSTFAILGLAGCATYPSYDNLGGRYNAAPNVSYSVGIGYGAYAPGYYPGYRPIYRPAYVGRPYYPHHHHHGHGHGGHRH